MQLEDAERLIEASDAYRLLRRLPDPTAWSLGAPSGPTRRAVFVDTETTGLDPDIDEVIELALIPFEYDHASGAISKVDMARAFSGLRQPAIPIPERSTRVHGITDADVAGRAIGDAEIAAVIGDAQLIIAHNAEFDRPMVEKHWPAFVNMHWACSRADIDWRSENIDSAKLDYILMRQGWFYEGHRAKIDALASVFLLSLPLPVSGQTAMSRLLARARRPLKAVRAEETAFEQRAALKARGYRWDAGSPTRPKAWWILTENPDAEKEWLIKEVYGAAREILVSNMPPTMRCSRRLWPD